MESKLIVAFALNAYLGISAAAGVPGAPVAGPATVPATGFASPARTMDASPSTIALMSDQQKMAGQIESLLKKVAELELHIQQKDRVLTANLESLKANYDKHTHKYRYAKLNWGDAGGTYHVVGNEPVPTDTGKPQ